MYKRILFFSSVLFFLTFNASYAEIVSTPVPNNYQQGLLDDPFIVFQTNLPDILYDNDLTTSMDFRNVHYFIDFKLPVHLTASYVSRGGIGSASYTLIIEDIEGNISEVDGTLYNGYRALDAKDVVTINVFRTCAGSCNNFNLQELDFFGSYDTDYVPLPVIPLPDPVQNFHYEIKSGTVILNWDGSEFADSYILYRNGIEIANFEGLTFTDKNVDYGHSYTYQVIARNEKGDSDPTTLTVEIEYPKPVVPQLRLLQSTDSTLLLNWNNVGEKYRIYLNENNVSEITSNYFNLQGLTPETTYIVYVEALDSFGRWTRSNELAITTKKNELPPVLTRPPPPEVSESNNPDLNRGSDELVRGANEQFESFLMLIPILVTIIILVFGVGWLIKIFKRKMNKAKTTSVAELNTEKGASRSHITATKKTQLMRSGSQSASGKNTSRPLYQRNYTYNKNFRRNFNYENYQKRFR